MLGQNTGTVLMIHYIHKETSFTHLLFQNNTG